MKKWYAAALIAAMTGLAVAMWYFATNSGEVVITVTGINTPVEVSPDGDNVATSDVGKPVPLQAAEHSLLVTSPRVKFRAKHRRLERTR